jgi:sarcosine oxidase subunit alpha
MEVDGVPNVQSETAFLRGGMVVKPQNSKWGPENDMLGPMDKLSGIMPAGFQYRRFHKPYKLWPFFLKRIRKAAGKGKLDPAFRMEGRYDEMYIHTDVCVIGGGPAGITAALAAAEQGVRVVLLESRPWLGGFFDYRTAEYTPGVSLYTRGRELTRQLLQGIPNLRVFSNTCMTGLYNGNLITAFQTGSELAPFHERYMEIRAKSVVGATGAIERPLLFDNNDLPGIMQMGCAHRLARTYGLVPGSRAVFSVGHDLGLEAAADLADLGIKVLCVADSRPDDQEPRLVKALEERSIPLLREWTASKAFGKKSLNRVKLNAIQGMRSQEFDCDLLVASAGLTPCAGPLFLAQAKMEYDFHTGAFLPKELPPNIRAAGRLLGFHNPFSIETSGRLAGLNAAKDCGAAVDHLLKEAQKKLEKLPGPARGSKRVKAAVRGCKSFICFDEDVTVENVRQACSMGFDTVELAKRFTGAGMGPGQGGIAGHNLPLVISHYHAASPEPVPLPSTVRPPLVPTLLATYAGCNRDMVKQSPLHDAQKKAGCIFRRSGDWQRARYFSSDLTCREEIEAVQNHVGIADVSGLGKFRIFGPDASKALNRIYVGDLSAIPEGKVRYSAACNEDGCPIDDGVMTQLAENDYYFTTTTERAGATVEWFRYHTRYDGWNFHMVNLTDAFGAIRLAGPHARNVLQKLTKDNISDSTFPFMGYGPLNLDSPARKAAKPIPVQVMRLGFLGGLSYEIHVPASFTETVWNLLMEAGKEFGIRPFGAEAQNVLTLEKGRVLIGQTSEIRTTLHDLGMGNLWNRQKAEKCVGDPALRFSKHLVGRLKLAGFKSEDPEKTPKDGSIVVDDTIRGYVTMSRYSFRLKASIGMALVDSSLAKEGTRLAIFEGGGNDRLYAKVVNMPFYSE